MEIKRTMSDFIDGKGLIPISFLWSVFYPLQNCFTKK